MGEDNIQLNLKYMLYKFYVSFNYIYNTYTKYIFKNQKNDRDNLFFRSNYLSGKKSK